MIADLGKFSFDKILPRKFCRIMLSDAKLEHDQEVDHAKCRTSFMNQYSTRRPVGFCTIARVLQAGKSIRYTYTTIYSIPNRSIKLVKIACIMLAIEPSSIYCNICII